jgi:hypothetical protein
MKIKWILVSEIFGALRVMEDSHKWDLSSGECACLAESFYKDFSKGFPKTKDDLHVIFERANVNTWGKDHKCHKVSDAELKDFLFSLSDSWVDFEADKAGMNVVDYAIKILRKSGGRRQSAWTYAEKLVKGK